MLPDIQARCRECQLLAPKPYVVEVAVPRDDLLFNSEAVVDIMYIHGKPVLIWWIRLRVIKQPDYLQARRRKAFGVPLWKCGP